MDLVFMTDFSTTLGSRAIAILQVLDSYSTVIWNWYSA